MYNYICITLVVGQDVKLIYFFLNKLPAFFRVSYWNEDIGII